MKPTEVFIAMFRAMDCLYWEDTTNEELREFCSDADPYIFKGRYSAIPSVENEFLREVKKKFPSEEMTAEEAYEATCYYLQTCTPFYALFKREITMGEWKDLCTIIIKEERGTEEDKT